MSRRARFWKAAWVVALAALSSACGTYRPARFAERAVVTVVRDDLPIPLPSRRSYDERLHVSDVYLRRPLVNEVRPFDFPTGGDVNALDEVVASTWYDPSGPAFRGEPADPDGPPHPPLAVVDAKASTNESALVVLDARGYRYEIVGDPPRQPGLRTAADVIGGALLRSLGYRTPFAWMLDLPRGAFHAAGEGASARLLYWMAESAATPGGGRRVSATRWPRGVDVGIGNDYTRRIDDPNDTIAPHDRRTLRAMKVFGQWLAWSDFGVRKMRDVYVGEPDAGHLVHYLVGTAGTLGTRDLTTRARRDERGRGFWWNLVTLGLYPPTVIPPRRSAFRSLGYLPEALVPGEYAAARQYSPFVRLTPADEYWAGKRLLELRDASIRVAIDAARLPDDAARHLLRVLLARRRILVEHAFGVVSPIDPEPMPGRSVLFRDRAIAAGFATTLATRYRVEFLGTDGRMVAPPELIAASGPATVVLVPEPAPRQIVLHVVAIRDGVASPRHCDVHVVPGPGSAWIVGVRH